MHLFLYRHLKLHNGCLARVGQSSTYNKHEKGTRKKNRDGFIEKVREPKICQLIRNIYNFVLYNIKTSETIMVRVYNDV